MARFLHLTTTAGRTLYLNPDAIAVVEFDSRHPGVVLVTLMAQDPAVQGSCPAVLMFRDQEARKLLVALKIVEAIPRTT